MLQLSSTARSTKNGARRTLSTTAPFFGCAAKILEISFATEKVHESKNEYSNIVKNLRRDKIGAEIKTQQNRSKKGFMSKIQTLDNLAQAYLGESQARNRYSFYASVARKEGLEQVAGIFQTTSDQEKEHASNLFKLIVRLKEETGISPEAALVMEGVEVPSVRGTTAENLAAAIAGEDHESEVMYPDFAKVAMEEGYADIAARLLAIAKAEEHHSQNYTKLLELVQDGAFFKRGEAMVWVCRECGYMVTSKEAPLKCPSCDHAQGYFELYQNNF